MNGLLGSIRRIKPQWERVFDAAMQAHAAGIVVGVQSAAQLIELAGEMDKSPFPMPESFTQDSGLINPNLYLRA